MTQDEIIELARQAWSDSGESWVAYGWFEDRAKALEAFAKLVAEKERERFIQICNHQADIATDYLDKNLLWQLRDAVKARGQA